MQRRDRQQGAALIMIIGVIAALAILASALVFLSANASSNTARDRNRAKAFNVAEAAADLALYKVGLEWPTSGDVSLTSTEKAAFLARFPSAEFADADVSIDYFDDVDANGDGKLTLLGDGSVGQRYDTGPNGLIYVEAQATVGGQKARIQLEAKRVLFDTRIPHGIPAATDGAIGGNNHKSSIDGNPLYGGFMGDQTTLTVMAGGTIYPDAPDPAYIPPENQKSGLGSGVVDGVLPPEILQGLIAAAQADGTWYSDIASEQAAGAKPIPDKNLTTPYEGLVVIETTDAKGVPLKGSDDYNGDGVSPHKPPGILIVIGPKTMYPDDPTKTGYAAGIDLAGNSNYYGIVYTDGRIWGTGTTNILGMALSLGLYDPSLPAIDLTGSRRISYNDNVLANINQIVQLNTQIVPNTWRQIQPQ
jgi:hypothetical protein